MTKSTHTAKSIAHTRKSKTKTGHPAKPVAHTRKPKTDDKALAALLRRANILKELEKALRDLGWIGDARVPLILFLAFTSRLLQHPVSIVIKGPSGGGKSTPVEFMIKFLPDGAFFVATGLSPMLLTRMGDQLVHTTIVIFEATGLDDEIVRGFLRTLLTENRAVYQTLGPDRKPRTYIANGPTNLITTTTQQTLHDETETRALSLFVEESKEHSRDIIMQQSRAASGKVAEPDVDFDAWHALQHYIGRFSRKVIIPYYESVGALIGDGPTRIHRDFPSFTSLVMAHALLHRCTRRHEGKAVVASIEDYKAVRGLMNTAFKQNAEAAVHEPVKAVVTAVEALLETKPQVTVHDLVAHLGLHRSTVSRNVGVAIKLGYLRNIELNQAKQALIVLGDPLRAKRDVLPTSKAVLKHWKANRRAAKYAITKT